MNFFSIIFISSPFNSIFTTNFSCFSVSSVVIRQKVDYYWKNTSSFDTLKNLINLNFDGLKEDALTALIHLGYLGYDKEDGEAYMPFHARCSWSQS